MCKSIPSIKNEKMGAVADWTLWLSRVLIVPLIVTMGYAWLNHEKRIDEMALVTVSNASNRFTSRDGLEVWQEIASLQTQVAILQGELSAHMKQSDGWIEVIRDHERRIGRIEN